MASASSGGARGAAAQTAHEADRWSIGTMLAFAGLCLLLGVLPGAAIDALAPVTTSVLGARMPPQPWRPLAEPGADLREPQFL